MRILVVEDDLSLASVIERNLKARGHETYVMHTAEDAIMDMIEQWPDVLLLDVNLPDSSAWEVLRRIGEGSRERLKVIIMSAFPISPKRIEEFKPAGALQKPFLMNSLLHLVDGSDTPETERSTAEG